MIWSRVGPWLLGCMAGLACSDIEPFDEGPLRLPPPSASEIAGFDALQSLAERVVWEGDAVSEEERLAANAGVLTDLEEWLAHRAEIRFPPGRATEESRWDPVEVRRLSELLLLRASAAAANGNEAAAAGDLARALELGRRLELGRGDALGYLVGQSLEALAWRWAREHARDGDWAGVLRAADHGIPTAALADTLRAEYAFLATTVDAIVESEEPMGGFRAPIRRPTFYVFQPERTRRAFFDTVSGWVAELDRPCSQREFPSPEKLTLVDYVKPNSAGRIVHGIATPSLEKIGHSDCDHEARYRGTAIALALVAYERGEGHLPEALDVLVPESLSAIPEDPFAPGRSLRYSAEARVIYSVGEDRKDDGGAEELDEVIEIP